MLVSKVAFISLKIFLLKKSLISRSNACQSTIARKSSFVHTYSRNAKRILFQRTMGLRHQINLQLLMNPKERHIISIFYASQQFFMTRQILLGLLFRHALFGIKTSNYFITITGNPASVMQSEFLFWYTHKAKGKGKLMETTCTAIFFTISNLVIDRRHLSSKLLSPQCSMLS